MSADVVRRCATLFASTPRLYPADRRMPRLAVLDGLRGVAALSVLIFHYRWLFAPPGVLDDMPQAVGSRPLEGLLGFLYNSGHYGVQLFWTMSGFVFAAVYYGRPTTSREFVVHRFARLYPLHFATLVVVAIEQYVAIARFGTPLLLGNYDLPHFLLQLGFASNWVWEWGNSFNAPIWSVSVEIVIYGVFWLTRGWLPRAGVLWPLAAAAAMAALRRFVGGTDVFQCGFYFFAGVALCTTWRSLADVPKVLLAIGLAAMALGAAGWRLAGPTPPASVLAILMFLLLGGLVLAVVAAEDFAPDWLRRPLGHLGDRTYSIYLVHWPLILLLMLVFGPRLPGLAQNAWFLAVYVGLVMAVAWPCYRWFEAPARDWLRRFARPARGVVPAPA